MIYRVRKQLVEEGFEAVLSRKRRMTPPVAAIFDGEKEAKLIALACSKPPKGRARWTLRLLESKVVDRRARKARRQHDLVRPAAVNSRRREFALAPDARSAA